MSWTTLPEGFPDALFDQALAGDLQNLNPVPSTLLQHMENLFFELSLQNTPTVLNFLADLGYLVFPPKVWIASPT